MKRLIPFLRLALASTAAAESVLPLKDGIAPQTRAEFRAGALRSGGVEKRRTRMNEPTGMARDSLLEKLWQTPDTE